jgi:Na+/H+ antiporter NhaD/arsenite permease-like protein
MAAQITAIVIFLGMFFMIILDKVERHKVTLVSGLLVLTVVFGALMRSPAAVVSTLNLHSMINTSFWYGHSSGVSVGINWSTIIFIAGMMVMVEGLGGAGVFRWLCLKIAKAVNYHNVPLLVCFAAASGLLSMFIDSITVMLFLAAVTVELGRTLEFDPRAMILSEIFCANLGGSATMCGDPPNIIIGTSLRLTFFDFLLNTGTICAICFALTLVYFYFCFRRELRSSEAQRVAVEAYPEPEEAIKDRRAFVLSLVVFGITVALLITHAQTTLSVASIGVISAALTLAASAISRGPAAAAKLLQKLDYKTLAFFAGLFIVVGGLEQTGVLKTAAGLIGKISGGNPYLMIAIIIWFASIASAFIDNIPFAATMVPVIKGISAMRGADLSVLAWTLSLGVDLGGNGTPIGASANVVGTSIAAKSGHNISWGRYCRYCAPAAIMATLVSMLCLFARLSL